MLNIIATTKFLPFYNCGITYLYRYSCNFTSISCMGRNTQVVIENNNLYRGPGGMAGGGKDSSYRLQRLCVTARSSHPVRQHPASHSNALHHIPVVPGGQPGLSGFPPRPPAASWSETEALGPGVEGEGGPGVSVWPLPFPSHAFQPASGLGTHRYPELIKVFDRFQSEDEFLPETSTIRFPKRRLACSIH